MFLDMSWTPGAVVVSVIIYNAAFGFRYAFYSSRSLTLLMTKSEVGDRFHGYTPQRYGPYIHRTNK